jgi:hypothetical protein
MFARCANPYHTPRYCRTLSHSSTFRSSTRLSSQVPFPRSLLVKWLEQVYTIASILLVEIMFVPLLHRSRRWRVCACRHRWLAAAARLQHVELSLQRQYIPIVASSHAEYHDVLSVVHRSSCARVTMINRSHGGTYLGTQPTKWQDRPRLRNMRRVSDLTERMFLLTVATETHMVTLSSTSAPHRRQRTLMGWSLEYDEAWMFRPRVLLHVPDT